MRQSLLYIIIVSFIAVSCGTKIKAMEGPLKNATVKRVIKRHQYSAPNFKTLNARLRGSYDDGDAKQSISISMRMKKDDTIWLSAKLAGLIPLAKVLITPDHVLFYDKVNRQFFDGDFSLLSKWLGTDLNFQKVQNLLLGQAIYPLKKDNFELKTVQNGYQLSSIDGKDVLKSFLIGKENFRLKGQQVKRLSTRQSVTITYPTYRETQKREFPKTIDIIVNQKSVTTKINIHYRTLEINDPVSFPFKVPAGYKEIQI